VQGSAAGLTGWRRQQGDSRRHRADAELESLHASTTLVRDSVLGEIGESSSLVASLAEVVKEDENWTRSALVTILPHFPDLEPELELLGFGHEADLSDDCLGALWPLASVASDSLVSLVPSLLARDPPDDVE
jgi:hypothetical protein